METIADIMKMDREKQSRPINTAEVIVERSLFKQASDSGHSNYQIGPNRRYPLSYLDTLPAVIPLYMYKVDVWPILNNTNTEYTIAELIEHC